MQRVTRMKREYSSLVNEPIPNVCVFNTNDDLTSFIAQIVGLKDSVYENGVFELEIKIPERYPFEPPNIKFVTPIYHPNIDDGGRICLDLLKMPPDGSWRPSLNLQTILCSIQLLITNPNLDDPLRPDIAMLCKTNNEQFKRLAREHTQKYAKNRSNYSSNQYINKPIRMSDENNNF